jgi:hypothetical protein
MFENGAGAGTRGAMTDNGTGGGASVLEKKNKSSFFCCCRFKRELLKQVSYTVIPLKRSSQPFSPVLFSICFTIYLLKQCFSTGVPRQGT